MNEEEQRSEQANGMFAPISLPKNRKRFASEVESQELIDFLKMVNQLNVIEFNGFLKLLCIETKEEGALRPYASVLEDLIDQYCALGKKKRKEYYHLLYSSLKETQVLQSQSKVGIGDILQRMGRMKIDAQCELRTDEQEEGPQVFEAKENCDGDSN